MSMWVRWFSELSIDDVPKVGGKNASLGEMIRELAPKGIRIPDGFAVTADAYRAFLRYNELEDQIHDILRDLDTHDVSDLMKRTGQVRRLILLGEFPPDMEQEIVEGYHELSRRYHVKTADVAVRSSATAEDLPTASFAGQQETYLNVHGEAMLLESVTKCFASLFTPRATSYRHDMGFDHFQVGLSVGVQKMVRSDLASSGVIFTLDTESGFRDVVFVTSSYGLGENIVQGRVAPDEFYVFKPALRQGFRPLIWKRLGTKELRMVYDEAGSKLVKNVNVSAEDRSRFSVSEADVLTLADWAMAIEEHYTARRGVDMPMDIEWAKDGRSGELFIVQARPETVHSQRTVTQIQSYRLEEKGEVLVKGLAVGDKIASGTVNVIPNVSHIRDFKAGQILVTDITDPDWEPIMKTAAAIITNRGGRTSHAAIVSRELGIPAIVGCNDATRVLQSGQEVTACCAEGEVGRVYAGELRFDVHTVDVSQLPRPHTHIMMNIASPELAFKQAAIPNDGVGLARMEFIFANWVQVHPLALTRYDTLEPEVRAKVDEITAGYADKAEFFVDKLAQGIGTLAAAFYPKPVILRLSDFKTNEYAHLVGGALFEPREENPMIGWRGASRYYHPDYREGFVLEVKAIKRVREEFGLTNLLVMVPFCRTPDEGRQVLEVMAEEGLKRGENGLQVYVMAEIPSNIILADQFSELFDGFSIGSNDLTQLTLGVDRDSTQIAALFNERNDSVLRSCAQLIETAHKFGRKVGICGQAPSDYPEFAAFLVEHGIDSMSLIPDAILRTTADVLAIEGERVAA
ncbi:MAG: phosphoenolpyruvate synthase [Caldilineaceae bacterium]|nr:phosphoenolpyruvate synthase [Caldilineaceae bacterium]MCB9120972.1 phosphoenolpyruvate synthase [Caldilineaceae bacterium]